MKVALITDGIWPYVLGGMQKHSYYLCKYMAANGVKVDLYHFNQSAYDINKLEFFTDNEKANISSFVVDFPKGSYYPGAYIHKSYQHSKLIYDAIAPKLAQYDFIYTKGFTGWYLLEQKHKRLIKCAPVGVKFHGYEMFQRAPDFKTKLQHLLLLRKPVKKISLWADVVFSYGGNITSIIKSLGVKESHIFEMPSGVETTDIVDAIKPVSAKLKFVFLGRYERRKGIEELNLAIESLLKTQHAARCEFHFIGPIGLEKQLKNKAVSYHGEIRDRAQLHSLLKQMDVLLCPSWSEGLPNSILEAMSLGLTVLATDVGAINILVTPASGWLIKEASKETILQAMETILCAGEAEVNVKKQHALNLIKERFTWERIFTNFYNRFLK